MRKLTATVAFISLLGGWLLPTTCEVQKADGMPTLSKAQWREDLQYIARELPKRHKNLFHTISQEQFEHAVAELDAVIPSLRDHQIIVRMLQITAKVGDAHTYLHLPDSFRRYPLSVYWFGSELRVVRATKEYKDALGTRVVKIGDVSITDVQARLLSVLSQAENEWFILNNSPSYMMHPEVLHTLGIVPDVGHAAFTLEDDEGKQFTLNIAAVTQDANLNSLLLSVAKSEPLSRQRPTERFWFTFLPESQTVYVSFRGYDSLGENARKLFQFVDSHPARRLVIDMRQNGGGDFTKVRSSLIPGIKQRPAINKKGHLFVVIGRRTFSAAMTNAIDRRQRGGLFRSGRKIPWGERLCEGG